MFYKPPLPSCSTLCGGLQTVDSSINKISPVNKNSNNG